MMRPGSRIRHSNRSRLPVIQFTVKGSAKKDKRHKEIAVVME